MAAMPNLTNFHCPGKVQPPWRATFFQQGEGEGKIL